MASMKGSKGLYPEEEFEDTELVDVAPLRSDRLIPFSGVNRGLSQYMAALPGPPCSTVPDDLGTAAGERCGNHLRSWLALWGWSRSHGGTATFILSLGLCSNTALMSHLHLVSPRPLILVLYKPPIPSSSMPGNN